MSYVSIDANTALSTVLLAIYRPYLAAAEGKSLSPDTQSIASQAEKAAAEMTTVLNEFISMNLTEMCTSQLITSTQAACQIYFWKIRHSSGLARQYAHNQLDLYMLALSDFRKTYCTADLQHKLFQEGLKALDGKPSTLRPPATEPNERQSEERRTSLQMDALTAPSQFGDGHMGATLEDFLVTFNPFMGMPMHEDLRSVPSPKFVIRLSSEAHFHVVLPWIGV